MDENTRRRRQEHAAGSSNPRHTLHDPNASRRSYGTGVLERYRHAPINTNPPGSRSIAAYYQEPVASFSHAIAPNSMAYTTDYTQDGRQTQGYNTYNTSMLYNVQQAGTQSTVYDTSQQFPSRQTAGMQMMTPDVAAPYFPSESANAAGLQSQPTSSSTSGVYQQTYAANMPSMSEMAQTGASEQVVEDPEYTSTGEPSTGGSGTDMGHAYEQYQAALQEVFTNIQNGALQTAGESLSGITEWLLSKVVELGLTGDDESLYKDRIKLWRDFNHAWLALFQRQMDMVESGQTLQRGQNLVSEDYLRKMGHDIVRLCNGIERHGLVDYECGVWEESIIDILEQCLDAYENGRNEASSSKAPAVGQSSHRESQ